MCTTESLTVYIQLLILHSAKFWHCISHLFTNSDVLLSYLTQPRLLVSGHPGQGQLNYICAGLLHELSEFRTYTMSLALIESDGMQGIDDVSWNWSLLTRTVSNELFMSVHRSGPHGFVKFFQGLKLLTARARLILTKLELSLCFRWATLFPIRSVTENNSLVHYRKAIRCGSGFAWIRRPGFSASKPISKRAPCTSQLSLLSTGGWTYIWVVQWYGCCRYSAIHAIRREWN